MTRRARSPRAPRAHALPGLALVALITRPDALAAQRVAPMRPAPVLRADVLLDSRAPTLHAGAGLVLPAGYQARLAIEGGAGATRRDGAWRPSGRLDVTARFLFDPFRETRWGVSAGGGAGLRWERGERPRPVALIVLGLQGRADRRWVRGVEVGVGAGVRLGVTFARPVPGRR